MTSKRVGIVLAAALLTALMLVSNPSLAQLATYNVVTGTDCNDWTKGKHDGLGEPENTLCQKTDLRSASGADKIVGKAGWDYMVSGAGDDLLIGNGGMDAFYAGAGNDVVRDIPAGTTLKDDENHDHAWLGSGDDKGNISDGYDEPNHIEEIHGGFRDAPSGTDTCTVDNDSGDVVQGCEHIRVVGGDGSVIAFDLKPGDNLKSAVPSGVRVTVKPAEVN